MTSSMYKKVRYCGGDQMNRKLQNTFCFQDETFEDACCYIFTSKNTLLNASLKNKFIMYTQTKKHIQGIRP